MNRQDKDIAAPRRDADMADYSDPMADDFVALARDRVPVRSMVENDLAAIQRIDRHHTGIDRRAYYERKLSEVMSESGIRVSLVAEVDGEPAGFVMARVDFGEFGKAEPMAVVDTLGVDPAYVHRGVGHALLSQLFANLATLHVETVRTNVSWDDVALLSFFKASGFAPSQRIILNKEID